MSLSACITLQPFPPTPHPSRCNSKLSQATHQAFKLPKPRTETMDWNLWLQGGVATSGWRHGDMLG